MIYISNFKSSNIWVRISCIPQQLYIHINYFIFMLEYKKEHMRLHSNSPGLIFCLCVSHYSWTSFQNLSPLLLQCSAHHSGFQNGGLYHTVYNLKHFFLINAMTGAQTQSYQGSQELLHGLIAFPYAWMNYRIALDGCKARGEIERLSYLFQLYQLPCTLHIYSHITPLFHQLCSFSNSQ